MSYNEHEILVYRGYRWYCLYKIGNCTICNKTLNADGDTYLGKDINGHLQHTCPQCKVYIKDPHYDELTIKNKKHSVTSKQRWRQPEPQSHLWRYLDLARFVAILSTQKLYFTRLDHFEDKYEGAICSELGLRKFETRDNYTRIIMSAAKIKRNNNTPPTIEKIEIERNKSRKEFDRNRELNRMQTFVSCWSENDCESEAMWRLYTKDMKCGVAIHTTYEKLFKSLNPFDNVIIGGVQYVKYDEEFNEANFPVWYKRKSLEYEKEVRAVYQKSTHSFIEQEKQLPVNLDELILEVVTSPEADNWFISLVKELCFKYNVHCNVRKSEIQTEVYY